MTFVKQVKAVGHLVDSGIMAAIMDTIIRNRCQFKVLGFQMGATNQDFSAAELEVIAESEAGLNRTLASLHLLGCFDIKEKEVTLKPSEGDATVPDDFYSTTNHETHIYYRSKWLVVGDQRMDSVISVDEDKARCKLLRDVRKGDLVACGYDGIRVVPEFKARDRNDFSFMNTEISSERKVEIAVKKLVVMMREAKSSGHKIVVVAGPVVVHTGGREPLCSLIRKGYVDILLSGNALAVHDVERALFGTSLGVDIETGFPLAEGHRNHIAAINFVNKWGGLEAAVEEGLLRDGIMYECVKRRTPFVLAGSLRDDGPLHETISDIKEAQRLYANALKGAGLVIILSTMLHGIATGNMIPSYVKTICVDINPAVVTKLADRGSSQTEGIVTDVGLFLHMLARTI